MVEERPLFPDQRNQRLLRPGITKFPNRREQQQIKPDILDWPFANLMYQRLNEFGIICSSNPLLYGFDLSIRDSRRPIQELTYCPRCQRRSGFVVEWLDRRMF